MRKGKRGVRVIDKAFLVRFFADGGFRVEGPFLPAHVQRLIDTGECQAWVRDWALFAMWGKDHAAEAGTLFARWSDINAIASRIAYKPYQRLKAHHYRTQEARHWSRQQAESDG